MIHLTVAQSRSGKFSLSCIKPSDTINAMVLGTTTAEVITVPAGAYKVLFKSNGDFYARHNEAGAIPATEVTDGTGSALNPTGWVVTPGDTIGVISPAACVLTLEFFA